MNLRNLTDREMLIITMERLEQMQEDVTDLKQSFADLKERADKSTGFYAALCACSAVFGAIATLVVEYIKH